jgi:hypothetical protein
MEADYSEEKFMIEIRERMGNTFRVRMMANFMRWGWRRKMSPF